MNIPDEMHLLNLCTLVNMLQKLLNTINSLLFDDIYTKQDVASSLWKMIDEMGLHEFSFGGGDDNVPSRNDSTVLHQGLVGKTL